MEGIVFLGLRRFVLERLGEPAWRAVRARAGLADRIYLPLQTYSSRELRDILKQVADETGAPLSSVLEDYGEFIAPELLRMYATVIDPSFRLLDIVARSHEILAAMVTRKKVGDSLSTSMRGERVTAHEAMLTYGSQQRLCAIVRGFVRGTAAHVGEPAVITEPRCMLGGHERCEIRVRTPVLFLPRPAKSSPGVDPPPSSRDRRLSMKAALMTAP